MASQRASGSRCFFRGYAFANALPTSSTKFLLLYMFMGFIPGSIGETASWLYESGNSNLLSPE